MIPLDHDINDPSAPLTHASLVAQYVNRRCTESHRPTQPKS